MIMKWICTLAIGLIIQTNVQAEAILPSPVTVTASVRQLPDGAHPKANILDGILKGIILTTSQNQTVHAFLGIPYAKPPVGDLRFQKPQDPKKWDGVRDATRQPPSCHQRKDVFFADFLGSQETQPMIKASEDCLYLNVFVPKSPKFKRTRNDRVEGANGLPVMVYIHGGFFASGSSLPKGNSKQSWIADPRELAAEGKVIVVTIQYRLGSFGFLFLGDESAPGNVGLADQLKALQWVKKNIGQFGGNKDSITVVGQDAGGTSAIILYNHSRLFQRLILQSAGIQHPWSFVEPKEAFRRALRLADLAGCPTSAATSKKEVVGCLKRLEPEDILGKEVGTSPPSLNFSPFVLTRDNYLVKDEPIETLKMFRKDDQLSVLIGNSRDEGSKAAMYFLPRIFPNSEPNFNYIEQDVFEEAISKMFPSRTPSEVRAVLSKIPNLNIPWPHSTCF